MHPFVAHLIGDFILQNEWMAVEKKRQSLACLVYVAVYLLPFLWCDLRWWQIGLIGLQHFAQDRTPFILWWMRAWKRVPREYWGEIPLYVDQSFHIFWIQLVLWFGMG